MERGRSLSELGRSMTWSDLRAFIYYLPASSHFRRKEDPEEASKIAWIEGLATPQSTLLGELYDLLETHLLVSAGQQRHLDPIVKRLAQNAMDSRQVEQGNKAQIEQPAAQRPKMRQRTAAEIRSQIKRVYGQ